MEYVVTAAQMQEHERTVINEIGLDAVILMERAAQFAAQIIEKRIKKPDTVLVVCGHGNNGADGIALARILTEKGFTAEILLLGTADKYSDLHKKQEAIFRRVLGETADERIHESLTDTKTSGKEYAVIVDAILGIGTSRELSGEFKEAVDWMNGMSALKIAMDIPTGICTDTGKVLGTAFRADITVTFGLRKQGLLLGEGKQFSGEICYDSCGMLYPAMPSKDVFFIDEKDVAGLIKRKPDGNKSTFGKLSFISGSETIAGAAVLNVCAAFRSGAGYCRLFTHEKNKEVVMDAAPETVLDLYDSDVTYDQIKKAVDFAHVICAGSGIGTDRRAKEIMVSLCGIMAEQSDKIFVLDADAINIIAADEQLKHKIRESKSSVVFTPHILEFSRLCGFSVEEIKADRVAAARKFATENGCVLVLKDAQTIIADTDGKVCISAKGNDGMAVAGSGDVLAGIIAGVAGQVRDAYRSACVGVYVHGTAGDMAAKKLGKHSMLPSDMIHYVKKCMKKHGKEAV